MKIVYVDAGTSTEANVKLLFRELGLKYEQFGELSCSELCNQLTESDGIVLVVAHGEPSTADLREWIKSCPHIKVVRIGISATAPQVKFEDVFDRGVASFDWLGVAGVGIEGLGVELAKQTRLNVPWTADKFLAVVHEYFKVKYSADDLIAAYLLRSCLGDFGCNFQLPKFGLGPYRVMSTTDMRTKLGDLIAQSKK